MLFRLLSTMAKAPVSVPLAGVTWIARNIEETAHAEYYSVEAVQRALAALERQLEAGKLSEEDYEAQEALLLDRLDEIKARERQS